MRKNSTSAKVQKKSVVHYVRVIVGSAHADRVGGLVKKMKGVRDLHAPFDDVSSDDDVLTFAIWGDEDTDFDAMLEGLREQISQITRKFSIKSVEHAVTGVEYTFGPLNKTVQNISS